METSHMDIDRALKDLGQFGLFQGFYFMLLLFPIMLSGFRNTEYIFTTMDIPHRCRVPECECTSGPADFSPPWLKNAIPFTHHQTPEVCQRFRTWPNATQNMSECSSQLFDSTVIETCNDWVFSEPARTVAHDFNIMCPADYWKRTILSSISLMTATIGLPFSGYFSDRFGRKTVLVFSSTILAVTGIIRSFSLNYTMLLLVEMFDGLLVCSVYDPAFLLGMETLAPGKRLIGVTITNLCFALGQVLVAGIVWWVQNWRTLQRIFYIPMLANVILHWLLPESVHWLYTNNRYSEVVKIFTRIAKLNKTAHKLPSIVQELKHAEQLNDKQNIGDQINKQESMKSINFGAAMKSKIIMKSLAVCIVCRGANAFVYFGLSQNSLQSDENRYLSFLLISLVEMPAYITSGWLPGLPFVGRRGASSGTFFMVVITCTAMLFTTREQVVLNMLLSMVSKYCTTVGITVIYIYMAEVFPTELRHSLFTVCAITTNMCIIAVQQISLIKSYVDPVLVYGVVSLLGGVVIFIGPETRDTKLPDTIQEAENIGKKNKAVSLRQLPSSSNTIDSLSMSASIATIETSHL